MDNEGETIELLGDAGATAAPAQASACLEGERPTEGSDDTAADSADSADSAGTADLSKDGVRERRTLVRRIARYKAVFPVEVSELAAELEGLVHKSPEELAALLEEVQFLVETRRSTAQARGLFLAGLSIGETAGQYTGLRLQGLTQVAAQSNDLLTTVDEVALKYEGVVQVDPVARLAMCVGQLALAVDAANRAREAGGGGGASTPADKPAVPSVQPATEPTINKAREEYSDL